MDTSEQTIEEILDEQQIIVPDTGYESLEARARTITTKWQADIPLHLVERGFLKQCVGTIELCAGKAWLIRGEPHFICRLKNIFKSTDSRNIGFALISHTDENSKDLVWILSRYKLYFINPSDMLVMFNCAARHEDLIVRLENIMTSGYTSRKIELAHPPRDYQLIAANLLLEQGHLLIADDVGIGKTVEAICTFREPKALPALVVTLAATLPQQWHDEIEYFAPDLRVHITKKATAYQLPKVRGKLPDVIVTNYHKISGWAEVLAEYCNSVVFDEIQELRHNNSGKSIAANFIASRMQYRLGLSATPIYNYGGEIFNIFEVLCPGKLGTFDEFVREWCPGSYAPKYNLAEPKAFGSWARERFLMIRRTRADVGRELPGLQKIPHLIECNKDELKKVEDSAAELAKIILSGTDDWRGERMNAAGQLDNLIRQATGIAKCLATGTYVLKADGTREKVENLKVGDLLMGPDSKPRTILSMSHGFGDLYEVSSTTKKPLFAPYVVNENHILALKHSGAVRHGDRYLFGQYVVGDHVEISVKDYLLKSSHFKRLLKGYTVGVEYPDNDLYLDPYFVGLWLGDGTSAEAAVTTADAEVKSYLYDFAKLHGINITVKHQARTAPTYRISTKIKPRYGIWNCISSRLRMLGLLNNKHIPEQYLRNSREKRMQLLAGLLDSDGHLNASGGYTISTKWEHLAGQINYLVKSLGLACKVKKVNATNQTKKMFVAYSISIYGEGLENIPVIVARKKASKRTQIKDPLRSGIRVKSVGVGNHHGFTLDGDGLFLLGDYTVTHNSPYIGTFLQMLLEDSDDHVLCYLWHRQVYEIIGNMLDKAKIPYAMFTGSESPAKKAKEKERFVSGECRLMLMSLRAGAGVDGLQDVCSTTVHGELDWSPGVHEQGIGRVYRDGQKKPVNAWFLHTHDGSDPLIMEVCGIKREQIEGIKNPGADVIEELQIDRNKAMDLARRILDKHRSGR